jgi:hypothetical protein
MKTKARPVRNRPGPKNTCKVAARAESAGRIQMFSTVRPAHRCLPIGSLGGRRDKITSEVCLPHTTHDARHASGGMQVYWFLVIDSPLYEHERCHNPHFMRQIKIFEFIKELLGFNVRHAMEEREVNQISYRE